MAEDGLVYGDWQGGKHMGCAQADRDYCFLRLPMIQYFESFGRFDETTKDEVFARANQRRIELSIEHGLSKNRYRIVKNLYTGDEWLQVQLTLGRIMECNMEHLEHVTSHTWCASKKRYTFYASTRTKEKKSTWFHRLVTGFKMVDHLNKNGLSNRTQNLRDATDVINQRNRRLNKNNTSGKLGVSVRKVGEVKAGWVDDEGKDRSRTFAIDKYGYDEAYRLAVAAREEQEILLGITPNVTMAILPVMPPVEPKSKPFACPICDYRTVYRKQMPLHIQRVHPSR